MVRCGSQNLQNKFQGILAHSKTSQNSQQRVECKLSFRIERHFHHRQNKVHCDQGVHEPKITGRIISKATAKQEQHKILQRHRMGTVHENEERRGKQPPDGDHNDDVQRLPIMLRLIHLPRKKQLAVHSEEQWHAHHAQYGDRRSSKPAGIESRVK